MIKRTLAMAILVAGVAWRLCGADTGPNLIAAVHPESIRIDAAYNGARVTVTGSIPSEAGALIRVLGKAESYKLKQKGRVLGLWMNRGSVEISKVPGLFLLYRPTGAGDAQSTDPPELGLESIRQGAEVVAQDQNRKELLDEFFKLKQKAGLYGTVANAIRYEPATGPLKSFTAVLTLPAALPQGAFEVEVFAIQNGSVVAKDVRTIEVNEVGLPAWISTLAFQHGTLYGTLAVLVAIMAGWLTGTLFKAGKGAH